MATRAEVPSAAPSAEGSELELDAERFVAGGVALARDADGKVVLVAGMLPGERARVRLTEVRPTMARAELDEVLHAAPGRVDPPCPELARGCGGCDLQHASRPTQADLKVQVVRDALARLARLPEVQVRAGEVLLGGDPYRTVLRCGVSEGRAGLRRRSSHEVLPLGSCLVAHPLIQDLLVHARFPSAAEVTIRVGARTGDRMVVVSPTAADVRVPAGVVVVGADGSTQGEVAHIHESVGRRRFRISAGSFFQARPDGAEALVRAVGRALEGFDPSSDRLLDLYGGVGLFSAGLAARRSLLVESSSSAVDDARINLADLDASVRRARVERFRPPVVDAVVADPPRAGLGSAGARIVADSGAQRVALVSCDPASLGRDVRLLAERGYQALGVELVDMFPHTHHLEAVTALRLTTSS